MKKTEKTWPTDNTFDEDYNIDNDIYTENSQQEDYSNLLDITAKVLSQSIPIL